MSASSQSFFNNFLSYSIFRLIATTLVVFIAISILNNIWVALQRRRNDDQKLKSFEKMKLNPRHWFFGHVAMVSIKGLMHTWALFLKTLCSFSKNKATLDKISYGSGQKCSKELRKHSFTSVETIVVKLQ